MPMLAVGPEVPPVEDQSLGGLLALSAHPPPRCLQTTTPDHDYLPIIISRAAATPSPPTATNLPPSHHHHRRRRIHHYHKNNRNLTLQNQSSYSPMEEA